MGWIALSRVLSDRISMPLLVLDASGVVLRCNRGMQSLLGWRDYELEGRSLLSLCEEANISATWIARSLEGATERAEGALPAKGGAHIALEMDVALVGRSEEQFLLIIASRAEVVGEQARRERVDFDYHVSMVGPEFGRLTKLRVDGEWTPLDGKARCFEHLYGRTAPCRDCPLLGGQQEGWPRLVVRPRGSSTSSTQFEVSTADQVDAMNIRVKVRVVPESALSAIHDARLSVIAEKAELTDREREVLRYLLVGRSIDEIAIILDIAPRTVKYHQANVLRKIGAESRNDLLRLVY